MVTCGNGVRTGSGLTLTNRCLTQLAPGAVTDVLCVVVHGTHHQSIYGVLSGVAGMPDTVDLTPVSVLHGEMTPHNIQAGVAIPTHTLRTAYNPNVLNML